MKLAAKILACAILIFSIDVIFVWPVFYYSAITALLSSFIPEAFFLPIDLILNYIIYFINYFYSTKIIIGGSETSLYNAIDITIRILIFISILFLNNNYYKKLKWEKVK